MDWPASDASVYAMIPFRKLRRSVSTENGGISRDYNADTTPIRIGVSRMRDEITPICAVVSCLLGVVCPASPVRCSAARCGMRPRTMSATLTNRRLLYIHRPTLSEEVYVTQRSEDIR